MWILHPPDATELTPFATMFGTRGVVEIESQWTARKREIQFFVTVTQRGSKDLNALTSRLHEQVASYVKTVAVGSDTLKAVTTSRNMKHMTIAVLAISLVVGVFSPALIPTLWHLRHGGRTEQEGRLIPVPPGWYASAELFRTVELIKPSLTVFSGAGSARASFGPLPGPPPASPEEFFKRFEDFYRKSRAEMLVRGPFKMGNSGSEAVCMQSLPAQLPGSASFHVSCSEGHGQQNSWEIRVRSTISSRSLVAPGPEDYPPKPSSG